MLYIATARCGAMLLPLEHATSRRDSTSLLQKYLPSLLLHDYEMTFDMPPTVPRIVNLSSLIATRCHHEPSVEEDATAVSLIVPEEKGISTCSLQQLSSGMKGIKGIAPDEFRISGALFDDDILAPKVLPVLMAGGTIIFR